MTAVINQDVNLRHFLLKSLPKGAVCLVPDENFHSIAGIDFALFSDINTIDSCFRAKILFPHVEAAPAEDAYFDNVDLLVNELGEVPVINIQIMRILPDTAALSVRFKVIGHRVRAVVAR